MKTDRKKLISILTAVRPGIAKKEVIEQTTSFIFTGDRVMAYNDEVCVQHPLPADVTLEGAVQAKELFALLNKLSTDEIELEISGNELLIKGGKTKSGIKLEVASSVPEIVKVLGNLDDWAPLPELFLKGIEFCLFSTGTDMTKPILTCVCIADNFVISSDNRRLTRFDMSDTEGVSDLGLMAGEQMLIPATSAQALKSYPVTEFTLTKGWLHFRTKDDAVFSCRDIEGLFPADKIHAILDRAEGELVKLPEGLAETLERAGIFSTADKKSGGVDHVKVSLTEGMLTVRGEGQVGWLEETSRVRYKGPEITFDVSSDFLSAILAHSGDMRVGENLLKFEGANFAHVVSVLASK